ncbi:MAG: Gldg family protein [Pseudohongiellaceae bacterium]
MKQFRTLVSGIGLAAVAAALVLLVAVIAFLPGWRIDLTEDKLYTLSDGTRNIVSNLEQPIDLLFFYSDSLTEDLPQIRGYATRVQELLEEIVIAGEGNLSLQTIDPEPFSEGEDMASQYGVQKVAIVQGREEIYFGLVAVSNPTVSEENPFASVSSDTLPLIRPDQEQFLEYEVMKLVTNAAYPQRPIIGLLTPLDIDGGLDPTTSQPTEPWMIMDIIRQLYAVRRIETDADTIDDDITILLLIHPEGLSEQMLYAIDQHVMRGGKVMAFLDPNADSLVGRSPQGTLVPAGTRSDLPGLLQAWGVAYDSSKVLTDNQLALRVTLGQTGRAMPHLSMLGIQRDYLAIDDIVTDNLESINLSSTGVISPLENATTSFDPILQSSTDAMLMDATILENLTDPTTLFNQFASMNQSYVIAARINGVINTAFPDGRPPEPVEDEAESDAGDSGTENQEATSGDEAGAGDDTTNQQADTEAGDENTAEDDIPAAEHLTTTDDETTLFIFADSDMLSDHLWVQILQFLGQRIPQAFANNSDLIVNALDNLSGGADLVSIRSRGRYSRPFTTVIELQRQADDQLRQDEAELQRHVADAEAQVAQLSQDEEGQPLTQITPEIQAQVDRLNADLLQTRRRLREVQYELTADIERLGSNLKWLNTLAIPALLTILALLTNWLRTRRKANP